MILFLLQISLGNQNRLNYMLHKFLIYVCLLHVLITAILLLITLLTGMEFVLEEWYHMVRASLQTRLAASLLNHLLMKS